ISTQEEQPLAKCSQGEITRYCCVAHKFSRSKKDFHPRIPTLLLVISVVRSICMYDTVTRMERNSAMESPDKKMPAKNFSREHRNRDSIFTQHIFFIAAMEC